MGKDSEDLLVLIHQWKYRGTWYCIYIYAYMFSIYGIYSFFSWKIIGKVFFSPSIIVNIQIYFILDIFIYLTFSLYTVPQAYMMDFGSKKVF